MATKIRLYKQGQSGHIQPPSGEITECVAGIVEVSESDSVLMRRCGWKDPPGGPQKVGSPDPIVPRPEAPTPDSIRFEFTGLLQQGTVALLKQIPAKHQEGAVQAGASDVELARAIIGHRHGAPGVSIVDALLASQTSSVPSKPQKVPVVPSVQESAPQAPEDGSEEDESYSAEQLGAMTKDQLLEFVDESGRPTASKLKKAELIAQILGEE